MSKLQQAIRESFPDQAQTVIELIEGTRSPFDVPAVDAWRRQCYHPPRADRPETIMRAIDAVLEGYGAEVIRGADDRVLAEYVNFGDTYDTTILYDYVADRYRVTSWGDWVERYGDRYAVQ